MMGLCLKWWAWTQNDKLAFETTELDMLGQGDEVALGLHPHSHWLSMSTVVAWVVISVCRRNWVRGGWVCICGCKREGLGGSGTRSPAHVASCDPQCVFNYATSPYIRNYVSFH
jgi:hypothetical protein